ncbi:hypothetical protein AGMMS50255_0840 [Spirochaetia bacterium]|nr:hypothetical protein AGMMS50255_0840 [Spirochaetia bacterium]
MTYQASSGIYVLITIMLTFKDWNCKQKSYKEIVSFAGIAALSFFLAMLSFRFIFMNPFNSYAGTAIFSPAQLISGILRNINNYIILVNNDFNIIWKVFIAVILILFIGKMVGVSAQNKIIAAFGSFFVIAALCIMSFGVYIVLENPLYAPRATYGFGIFLSIISISVISDRKKINMISVLALNWCFLIFSFSYGNALADQKRYTDFRAEMLLRDLSALFPNRTMDDMPIQMRNSIEFAPSIKENIAKRYPVIERLILPQLSNWYWSYHYLIQYFNWGTEELVDRVWDTIALVDFAAMDLPVVFDSFYHTIKSDGEKILIELKN